MAAIDPARPEPQRLWTPLPSGSAGFDPALRVFELHAEVDPSRSGWRANYRADRLNAALYPAVEPSLMEIVSDQPTMAEYRIWAGRTEYHLRHQLLRQRWTDVRLLVGARLKFLEGPHMKQLVKQLGEAIAWDSEDPEEWAKVIYKKLPKVEVERVQRLQPFEDLVAVRAERRKLFKRLGYQVESREGITYMTAPTPEELQRRWAELRKEHPLFPELHIEQPGEELSDLVFAEATLRGIVRDTGSEEMHDVFVHEMAWIQMVEGCVRDGKNYDEIKSEWIAPLQDMVQRVRTLRTPDGHPSERAKKLFRDVGDDLLDMRVEMLEAALGTCIDVVAASTAFAERKSEVRHFSSWYLTPMNDPRWITYFARRFSARDPDNIPADYLEFLRSDLFGSLEPAWNTLMSKSRGS